MKDLNNYILEKLKINKDSNKYHYHPKDEDELRSLIQELLKERGNDTDLNDIDVSDIMDMSELFYGLDPHKIDISEWNVSNVKNMGYMFAYSKFNQDISNWDVSNGTTMDNMFGVSPLQNNPPKWYKQ